MFERPFDLRWAEPCIGPSVVPLYELASVEMVGISEADAAAINLITNKGNEMENKVLDEIVKYAAKQLNNAYGFCGVASSPNSAFLNSSDREGNDIFIKIEVKPE